MSNENLIFTIEQKRQGFSVNDIVYTTPEYRRIMSSPNPNIEAGQILSFRDPYSWETQTSIATIHCKDGCIENISVGWLSPIPF